MADRRRDGRRPFVVIGWESLTDHLDALKRMAPKVLILDEMHMGKGRKRWDAIQLPPLPEGEDRLKKMREEHAEAKKKGGFIKENQEVPGAPVERTMLVPVMNRAAAAALLARNAPKRIALTATPIADRPRELWAQLDTVEPNAHGNKTDWLTRYCLVPETPVLMGDGTYKPIGEIVEGDEVIGWSRVAGKRFLHRTRVVATARREAEVVQLRTESGWKVRCTPDHHWLRSWSTDIKGSPYRSVYKEAAYSTSGRVRHLTHLQPMCFYPQETNTDSTGYKLGYIRGLLDGDGHARILKGKKTSELTSEWGRERRKKNWRKGRPKTYQMMIFAAERAHLDRAAQYATDIGLETTGVKTRSNPDGWTLGFYNKEAYRRISCSRGGDTTEGYKRGWLAGMYDAEGSGNVISQYQKTNPDNYSLLAEWLQKYGFKIEEIREKRHAHPVGWRINGGRKELLRFFDLTRPCLLRKLDRVFQKNPNFRQAKLDRDCIKTARPLKGLHVVVSIQTETGNYIADGYGSKNCGLKRGKWGMDDSGATNMEELAARLEHITHKVPAHVAHAHLLHKKRRQPVYIAPEDQTAPSAGFGKEMAAARKRGPSALLECRIARAASKKRRAVVDMVDDHVGSDHKVVVFTARRRDCDELGDRLRKARMGKAKKVEVWSAHGDHSVEARQQIVDDYMAHPGPCVLVGTMQAFGQSINLADTDAAFMVMLPYTPEMLRQAEGRFVRLSMKRAVVIYYVIAEATVDEHIASILIDKLPAVEEIADDQELGAARSVLAGIDPNISDEDFASAVLAALDE
jgi:hypothetical protein